MKYEINIEELEKNEEEFKSVKKVKVEYIEILEYMIKNNIKYLSFFEIFDKVKEIFNINKEMSIVSLRNNINLLVKNKIKVEINKKVYILKLSKMKLKVNNNLRKRSIYFVKEI
jgi:hypothetical protein